jgi:hypothetical protein
MNKSKHNVHPLPLLCKFSTCRNPLPTAIYGFMYLRFLHIHDESVCALPDLFCIRWKSAIMTIRMQSTPSYPISRIFILIYPFFPGILVLQLFTNLYALSWTLFSSYQLEFSNSGLQPTPHSHKLPQLARDFNVTGMLIRLKITSATVNSDL